jgi:type I restriction enzyme, S subunit
LIKDEYIIGIQDGNHGESHSVSTEFVSEGIPFVMASDISEGYIDKKT